MTVRTFAAHLIRGSARRRSAVGCILLASVALLGLYGAAALSGLYPSSLYPLGFATGDPAFRQDENLGPNAVPLSTFRIARPLNAAHLESLINQAGFDLAAVRGGTGEVPRLYVRHLPRDLAMIEETARRKRLFFATLLPLILIANEELRVERARVVDLRDRILRGVPASSLPEPTNGERRWLASVHARYGTETGDWEQLLLRLDDVPVSLIVAQAAQESGWGTSRFARDGNALFGQRTWRAGEPGLVPVRRADGQSYRVRAFSDLMASIRSYIHNINTHDAYRELRTRRSGFHAQPVRRPGVALAAALSRYSEESGSYIKALTGLIRDNDLSDLNRARLRAAPEQVVSRTAGGA